MNVVGAVEKAISISASIVERLGCGAGAAGSHPVVMRRDPAREGGQQRGKQSGGTKRVTLNLDDII